LGTEDPRKARKLYKSVHEKIAPILLDAENNGYARGAFGTALGTAEWNGQKDMESTQELSQR